MKRMIWIALILVLFLAGCVIYVPRDDYYGPQRTNDTDRANDQYGSRNDISYFYDYLADYGDWVWNGPAGYVWLPRDVPYRWRPYSHGRWIWTDYGWTWVSAFEWGWIPFHYGRWGWDRDLGWFWVPDTVWGPAWVAWRWGDMYYGWAPLPPGAVWRGGLIFSGDIPDYYWVFLDGRYFLDADLYRYVLPYERNITIIHYTVIKTNIVYRNERIINEGIDIDQIRRATRHDVVKYELRDARQPGQSRLGPRELEIYRPELVRNDQAKPRRVIGKDEAGQELRDRPLRGLQKRSLLSDEEELKEDQQDERRLLERSQEDELNLIKRKADEDLKKAPDAGDKQKIEKDYEDKLTDFKQRHAAEKEELDKRQKAEADKVKKRKLKKDDGSAN